MSYNYNSVISVKNITAESGDIAVLVSLTKMKDYLRLQGFVDTDGSPSTDLGDFDFDDNLLRDMITGAAELIEEKAGISLTPRTLHAVVNNLCGWIEIPFGPVNSITSVKDVNGNTLVYTTSGNFWMNLKTPLLKEIVIIYEAGYHDIPKGIIIDIMRLVAFMYENRGGNDVDDFAYNLVSKYSRNTGIV